VRCSCLFARRRGLGSFTIPVSVWFEHEDDRIQFLDRRLKLRDCVGGKFLRFDIRIELVERLRWLVRGGKSGVFGLS
jgi:hypothetical protein